MKRDLWDRLLGSGDRDSGCEAGFEVLDAFVEAILRGDDVEAKFPGVVAHLAGCPACREDTEGLIAALRRAEPEDDSK